MLMTMTKQELRRQIRQQIQQLSAADRDTQSLYVCLQILGTAEWQSAQTVMLYEALPDEVSLQLLIDDARGSGKEIILPDQSASAPAIPDEVLQEVDFAVIPGRAFSRSGHRLGRGGGWYDRLLPKLRCPKWGAAFKCQIKQMVPCDAWDVRMDRVVTA